MKDLSYKDLVLKWDPDGSREGCWRSRCKWGTLDVDKESRGVGMGLFFWFLYPAEGKDLPRFEFKVELRYFKEPQDALIAAYYFLSIYEVIK